MVDLTSRVYDTDTKFIQYLFATVSNYKGVSKNNGTPKSPILIGFSIVNHPFWGTPIFGNAQLIRISGLGTLGVEKQGYQLQLGKFFHESTPAMIAMSVVFFTKLRASKILDLTKNPTS